MNALQSYPIFEVNKNDRGLSKWKYVKVFALNLIWNKLRCWLINGKEDMWIVYMYEFTSYIYIKSYVFNHPIIK
jgi:hypothetical protein